MAAQPPPTEGKFMTKPITITVFVDAEGKPYVDQHLVRMPKDEHDIKIHWTMDSTASAWTFTEAGISFDDGGNQFSDPKKTHEGKGFHWTNANTNTNSYTYHVNVTDTRVIRSVDPIIENDGSPHAD